jgi:hypothetical protein
MIIYIYNIPATQHTYVVLYTMFHYSDMFRLVGHNRATLHLLCDQLLQFSDIVQCRKEILNPYVWLKLL